MHVHIFPNENTREIYNVAQTSDKIKDGDILVCIEEKVIGIMVGAWPVSLDEKDPGEFHILDNSQSWTKSADGKYLRSWLFASKLSFFDFDTYYPHAS